MRKKIFLFFLWFLVVVFGKIKFTEAYLEGNYLYIKVDVDAPCCNYDTLCKALWLDSKDVHHAFLSDDGTCCDFAVTATSVTYAATTYECALLLSEENYGYPVTALGEDAHAILWVREGIKLPALYRDGMGKSLADFIPESAYVYDCCQENTPGCSNAFKTDWRTKAGFDYCPSEEDCGVFEDGG